VIGFTYLGGLTGPAIQRAVNAMLPPDVAIRGVRRAPNGFHPRHAARYREYRYTVWNGPRSPLRERHALGVRTPLDIAAMAGQPVAAFVSVGLPRQGGLALAQELHAGMNPRFFVRGVLELLDEPGEWCLKQKEGFVYYRPVSGTPDDHLIVRLEGLERRPEPPERRDRPVLDSRTFGCTQPYVTVARDRETDRFRLWYNRGPAVWHAQSEDGLTWVNPRVAWDLPRGYGASLVDDGDRARDHERRYKLANWQATRAREDRPGDDGGMYVGFSPDGFRWTAHDGNPVLPTWPEGYDKPTRHGVGDIVDVYYDPLSKLYGAAVKVHAVPEDGYAPGPRAGKGIRRLVGLSTSPDFLHWERPRRIFAPDERDDGLLEFYGMGTLHLRGSLRIGLVRVLRDDLSCDPGGPKDGVGYSGLATSRDGINWQRRREPFLDRNPARGSWDHAMTWIGAAVPVSDELSVTMSVTVY
jgi:hypothetical protein